MHYDLYYLENVKTNFGLVTVLVPLVISPMQNFCTHNPHNYLLRSLKNLAQFKDWKMVNIKEFFNISTNCKKTTNTDLKTVFD